MRLPHVILLTALCLPLQAGEGPELERAVKKFHSNDPGVRAQGTKLADTELRRLLAPLLKAMDDSDPEVRRRAREAILNLVPHHGRDAEQQDGNPRLANNPLANRRAATTVNLFGAHGHIAAGTGIPVTGITPNSGAAKAGLKLNDTIISWSGVAVTTYANLSTATAKCRREGWKVAKFKVLRGKKTLELTVRLTAP